MSTTINGPAVIDLETMSVSRSIHIDAPAPKVWAAITQPEHIARWFSDSAALDGDRAGAQGTLTWNDHGTFPVRIEAIEPEHSITYAWNNDGASGELPEQFDADHATTFTFTLEPEGGGTRLTVVETGFERTSDPTANLEDHRGGWVSELDELVAYLEGAA